MSAVRKLEGAYTVYQEAYNTVHHDADPLLRDIKKEGGPLLPYAKEFKAEFYDSLLLALRDLDEHHEDLKSHVRRADSEALTSKEADKMLQSVLTIAETYLKAEDRLKLITKNSKAFIKKLRKGKKHLGSFADPDNDLGKMAELTKQIDGFARESLKTFKTLSKSLDFIHSAVGLNVSSKDRLNALHERTGQLERNARRRILF